MRAPRTTVQPEWVRWLKHCKTALRDVRAVLAGKVGTSDAAQKAIDDLRTAAGKQPDKLRQPDEEQKLFKRLYAAKAKYARPVRLAACLVRVRPVSKDSPASSASGLPYVRAFPPGFPP